MSLEAADFGRSQGEMVWSDLNIGNQLEKVRRTEYHLRSWTNDEPGDAEGPPWLVK